MKLLLFFALSIQAFAGWGTTETEDYRITLIALHPNPVPEFGVPGGSKFTAMAVIQFKDPSKLDRSGEVEYRITFRWRGKDGATYSQTRTAALLPHGIGQSFTATDLDEALGAEVERVEVLTLREGPLLDIDASDVYVKGVTRTWTVGIAYNLPIEESPLDLGSSAFYRASFSRWFYGPNKRWCNVRATETGITWESCK